MKIYYVYILANKRNGTLYIGVTNDLKRRIYEHKEKLIDGFTKTYDVNILVWYESTELIESALTKEKQLKKLSKKIRTVRKSVEEYDLGKKKIYLLAEGRLVNLGAADGHPASVMDMSFAGQAMAAEYMWKNKGKLENKVHTLPAFLDNKIAQLKLKSEGIKIDILSDEQKKYLSSWNEGT